jgi:hypothetical protein
MNILNTVEREAFESPPIFNSVQRKQYFDFPTELRRLAGELRAPTHQLGFLLSAGYFKAAKRFFPPSAFHRRDLEYVARQLELEDLSFDISDYNPRTRQLHEITIRTFYGFRVFDPEARRLLLKEIAGMVRSQLKPKLMLWLCVDALVREKIEVPSYTRLTKLILGAINRRKQELATIIEHALDQDARGLLDGLLTQEPIEGGTEAIVNSFSIISSLFLSSGWFLACGLVLIRRRYVVRSKLRQVQVRQHGTVFEVIKMHVEAVPQVVADMPHRRCLEIAM